MIEVEHLTKRYGEFTAVKDLSFTIDEGHVYGFLGPNGAGKSTTMNMMTGCLSATAGHVRVDGHDIFDEPNQAKKQIGYLPEQPPLYMNETPAEYLRFVGEAKGLRGAQLRAQIESVMEQTKITEMRNRRISALSKGYKQRVGIAQALLGDPKVIILDEPTVGLDPLQIIEIRDLIRQLGQSHTVILSSHILSEVQTICDKILIISHGQLIAFDTPENLEKSLLGGNGIDLTAQATPEEVTAIVAGLAPLPQDQEDQPPTAAAPAPLQLTTEAAQDGYTRAHLTVAGEDIYAVSRQLFFAFAQAGKALVELSLKKATLEDVFLELTEKDPAASSDLESEPKAEDEAPAQLEPAPESLPESHDQPEEKEETEA